jgi:hypothetical protein
MSPREAVCDVDEYGGPRFVRSTLINKAGCSVLSLAPKVLDRARDCPEQGCVPESRPGAMER